MKEQVRTLENLAKSEASASNREALLKMKRKLEDLELPLVVPLNPPMVVSLLVLASTAFVLILVMSKCVCFWMFA